VRLKTEKGGKAMIIKKRLAVVLILIVVSACLFGYWCDRTILDLVLRLLFEVNFAAFTGVFGVLLTMP